MPVGLQMKWRAQLEQQPVLGSRVVHLGCIHGCYPSWATGSSLIKTNLNCYRGDVRNQGNLKLTLLFILRMNDRVDVLVHHFISHM